MTKLADRYGSILFDLDGVLFRGAEPVPHAASTIEALRTGGTGMAFMTNNSSRTPEMVAEHLAMVGIRADADEVETSALTTAEVLSRRRIASAFVIGEVGLKRALEEAGIAVARDLESPADCVVVGFDRSVDYEAIRVASVFVQRGAPLIASNVDPSYPSEDGLNWPGAGAILAALVATTGAEPEVMGKPHAPMFESALRRAGGGRPLVVGDRLDTDIEGAVRLGWDSLLVLSGVTQQVDVAQGPVPTYVAPDIGILLSEKSDVVQGS
jgi:HAD superfamily hydrolase (TIGR01457 family)